jgi:hypothetical protein
MHRPGGPTLAELAGLGVARITFGGGLYADVAGHVRELADGLAAEVGALPHAGARPGGGEPGGGEPGDG